MLSQWLDCWHMETQILLFTRANVISKNINTFSSFYFRLIVFSVREDFSCHEFTKILIFYSILKCDTLFFYDVNAAAR